MKTKTGLTYFKKGSPEAKAHMAKLRAMAAAKRVGRPVAKSVSKLMGVQVPKDRFSIVTVGRPAAKYSKCNLCQATYLGTTAMHKFECSAQGAKLYKNPVSAKRIKAVAMSESKKCPICRKPLSSGGNSESYRDSHARYAHQSCIKKKQQLEAASSTTNPRGRAQKMTWEKWEKQFQPELAKNGDYDWLDWTVPSQWKRVIAAAQHNRVWTEVSVDRDDGKSNVALIEGIHYVNRMQYIITKKPYAKSAHYEVIDNDEDSWLNNPKGKKASFRVKVSAKGVKPNAQKMMTAEILKRIPKLYSQEKVADPLVHVKFFTPWANWTWYATEFDGQDQFFGLVVGQETELGYFSLAELQSIKGPGGLRIERDYHFGPTPLSKVKAGIKTNPKGGKFKVGNPNASKLLREFLGASWEPDYLEHFADRARKIVKLKQGAPKEIALLQTFLKNSWEPDFVDNFAHTVSATLGFRRHEPGSPAPRRKILRPDLQNPKSKGNPPAYFVIDPQTNRILKISRVSTSMDQAFRKALAAGKDSAKQLGRRIAVIVHPYTPKAFNVGTQVSSGFFLMGGYVEVDQAGEVYQVNPRKGRQVKSNSFWMNESEVDYAVELVQQRAPQYLPYAIFLRDWKDIINQNSDGWPYWRAGSGAAEKLQILIDSITKMARPSVAEMKAALTPIRSMATRKKLPVPVMPSHSQKGLFENKGKKSASCKRHDPVQIAFRVFQCKKCGATRQRESKTWTPAVRKNPILQTLMMANPCKNPKCRVCGTAYSGGEGWDGMCGNCADKAESKREKSASCNPSACKNPKHKHRRAKANPARLANPPFRNGQKIPIEKARAWIRSTGNRELLKQFEDALKLQTKANKPPTYVVWKLVPIGSKKKIDAVTAMVHYGDTPETMYTPPKGSKKGSDMYRHKWGEDGGGKRSVPLLAAAGGKALVMPLDGKKVAGDWLRH